MSSCRQAKLANDAPHPQPRPARSRRAQPNRPSAPRSRAKKTPKRAGRAGNETRFYRKGLRTFRNGFDALQRTLIDVKAPILQLRGEARIVGPNQPLRAH